MPSTPEPLRSRDERLTDVYRRADRLRRRRHLAVGAAVAAVLLPALAVAALQGEDEGGTTLVADAPEGGTTEPTMATTTIAPPHETAPSDGTAPAEEEAAPEGPAPTTTTSWPVTGPGPAPATTTTAPSDHGATLRHRSFRSTSATHDGQPRPLADGTTIDVQFADEGSGDLIRWRSGCNTAGGPLVVTADRLDVEDGGSTAMGCDADRMAQEEWVHAFFLSDPSWAADGSRLTLTSGSTVIELDEISYDDFWS